MATPDYPHLRLEREKPVTDRRPRRGFRSPTKPDEPQGHGRHLRQRLDQFRDAGPDFGGYDNRRLMRIHLSAKVPPEEIINVAKGIDFVSQENDTLVLAFATDEQLASFREKLDDVAKGRQVTYRGLIYALHDLDKLTPEDRTGWSLKREGLPDSAVVTVDVDLWPLARADEMDRLRSAFLKWLKDDGGDVVDSVQKPYLSLYRTKCPRNLIEKMLEYRDVRLVDLPPQVALDPSLLSISVQDLELVPEPPDDAPGVVVLDSGLATGHPVLAPAVGDAQSFLPGKPPADDHGHGTHVAGIALYGDVAQCLEERRFVPELRLYSGRILDGDNRGDARLIENQVEEAVRYFLTNYGCKDIQSFIW